MTEGESVAVCIKLFSSPEQEITMLSDIFPVVSQANAFSEMVAGRHIYIRDLIACYLKSHIT